MADYPTTYRKLLKLLKKQGVIEDQSRGKGSERMLVGMVDGVERTLPTKCHKESDEKPKGVIKSIRRHFKLTAADGVSDQEFYSG